MIYQFSGLTMTSLSRLSVLLLMNFLVSINLFAAGEKGKVPRFTGLIFPSEQVVLSTLSSGVVDFLPFKEGSLVKKGRVLLRMDTRRDSLELVLAERAHERSLIEKSGETEKKIAVALKRVSYEENFIKAPFTGSVIKLMAKRYEYYNGGAKVIEFADLSKLITEIHVPKQYLDKLKKGKLKISVTREGKTAAGKLNAFSPVAEPGMGLFLVKILFPNKHQWAPGTQVKVSF